VIRFRYAILIVAMFVICGCSGHRTDPPAPIPVPTATDMASLRYPLDGYRLSARQQAEEDYLYLKLERECMHRLGFDFLPGLTSRIDERVAIKNEIASRRYGITDLSIVRTAGYNLTAAAAGPHEPQSRDDLPPVERAALIGTAKTGPVGGCVGEASRELDLNQKAQTNARTVNDMAEEAFRRTQSDPRVQAVFASWSRCMSTMGFIYGNPIVAAGDPRWHKGSGSPSKLELATAKTDIACKVSTNLIGVEYATEADWQNIEISHNASTLRRISRSVADRRAELEKLMRRMPG
jgi:hypothetical protein